MNERPLLAFYSDCPVFGGADLIVARLLADARLSERWRPRLLFRDNPGFREGAGIELAPSVDREGLRLPERLDWIEALESGGIPKPLLLAAKLLFRLLEPGLFAYDVVRIALALRRLGPALVHVNDGGYPGALGCRAAAVAARMSGARVVFAVHNQASPRRPWELLDALIDPLVAACVDAFVTASPVSQAALARRFDRRRMVLIPDGVPTPAPARSREQVRAELGLENGETVFVMTAFFEPRKGHAVLLEALALLARDPEAAAFRVLLIGDGPTREAVESAARIQGLEARLRFLGYRRDAGEILAASDGMLLPSIHSEDMPLAILDAMALGKPVVSTRLAAIPRQVEHEATGFLAEPGDAASLAAAVKRLAADADLRGRLGRAGREKYLKEFTVSVMAGRYLDLYARVADDRPA